MEKIFSLLAVLLLGGIIIGNIVAQQGWYSLNGEEQNYVENRIFYLMGAVYISGSNSYNNTNTLLTNKILKIEETISISPSKVFALNLTAITGERSVNLMTTSVRIFNSIYDHIIASSTVD